MIGNYVVNFLFWKHSVIEHTGRDKEGDSVSVRKCNEVRTLLTSAHFSVVNEWMFDICSARELIHLYMAGAGKLSSYTQQGRRELQEQSAPLHWHLKCYWWMYEMVELRGVKKCDHWQTNYSSESCGKANNPMKAFFCTISWATNAISDQCESAGKPTFHTLAPLRCKMSWRQNQLLPSLHEGTLDIDLQIHEYSLLMKLQ